MDGSAGSNWQCVLPYLRPPQEAKGGEPGVSCRFPERLGKRKNSTFLVPF